ncbi:MAG: ABC transporter ATP-binding protein [Wenzhouxiangellaceae bacterium]
MLSIEEVSKTYANGVKALDNVSLTIERGMFGLLGPNGAGKSTLMRTLATLQLPDQGRIQFDGIDVLTQPGEVRARLGYLPQDFGVYPRISAAAMLDHMALLKGFTRRGERRELVAELLRQTNLYDVRKKAISGFSGGMRQRFGIAQALIGDPQLLIVDEPTAGLDPEERNRFHNLLSDIGENKVVILSTHIVEDVADLCPRMAILTQGRIALQGRPLDLIEALKGRIWRKTVPRDELAAYRDKLPVISTHLYAGNTLIHVLSDDLPEAGFSQADATLEDVYFSTVAGHSLAA